MVVDGGKASFSLSHRKCASSLAAWVAACWSSWVSDGWGEFIAAMIVPPAEEASKFSASVVCSCQEREAMASEMGRRIRGTT